MAVTTMRMSTDRHNRMIPLSRQHKAWRKRLRLQIWPISFKYFPSPLLPHAQQISQLQALDQDLVSRAWMSSQKGKWPKKITYLPKLNRQAQSTCKKRNQQLQHQPHPPPPLIAPPSKGTGFAPSSGEKPQGPSLINYEIELEADFLLEMVVEM